jgi:transposase
VIGLPSLEQLDQSSVLRIWLSVTPADMRCDFDRLAELARNVTGREPTAGGDLFLFRGRGGDRLKILYWDKDGVRALVQAVGGRRVQAAEDRTRCQVR